MINVYIIIVLQILLFLGGIYAYNKHKNNKIYWDSFKTFRVVLIFPLLDVITTVLFIN